MAGTPRFPGGGGGACPAFATGSSGEAAVPVGGLFNAALLNALMSPSKTVGRGAAAGVDGGGRGREGVARGDANAGAVSASAAGAAAAMPVGVGALAGSDAGGAVVGPDRRCRWRRATGVVISSSSSSDESLELKKNIKLALVSTNERDNQPPRKYGQEPHRIVENLASNADFSMSPSGTRPVWLGVGRELFLASRAGVL